MKSAKRVQTNILCVIFRTVVLIFIVGFCNTTFRPLYPPAFFWCPLFIWVGKSFLKFPWLNHFHTQKNKGYLKKGGRYSGQDVVLQITTIKMRTTVRKITHKILHIKPISKKFSQMISNHSWYRICNRISEQNKVVAHEADLSAPMFIQEKVKVLHNLTSVSSQELLEQVLFDLVL